MSTLPAILKFGLTGLAAIVVYLAYQLLLGQSKNERPNRAMLTTIKSFMILGVVLAIISAISSAVELITNSKYQASLYDLQTKLEAAEGENTRLREAAGNQKTTGQLEQQLSAAEAEIERLKSTSTGQQEIEQLKSELASARKSLQEVGAAAAMRRAALDRIIADQLEEILIEGSGKVRSVPESDRAKVRRSLLRRAVFLNMLAFEADGTILRSALQHLINRGHADLKPAADEILTDLPKLKATKLRWLQDNAIPALTEEIQKISRSPVQGNARADVPLPKEFVVVSEHEFGEPKVTITDMARLQEELALLKNTI